MYQPIPQQSNLPPSELSREQNTHESGWVIGAKNRNMNNCRECQRQRLKVCYVYHHAQYFSVNSIRSVTRTQIPKLASAARFIIGSAFPFGPSTSSVPVKSTKPMTGGCKTRLESHRLMPSLQSLLQRPAIPRHFPAYRMSIPGHKSNALFALSGSVMMPIPIMCTLRSMSDDCSYLHNKP